MKFLALLLVFVATVTAADTEPEFHLCARYVSVTQLNENADGWWVMVKLSEQGADSLTEFGEANLGRMIRIVANGLQFARFTIWAQGSDTLSANFDSREEAKAWHRTLDGELAESPCGAEARERITSGPGWQWGPSPISSAAHFGTP